MIELGVTDEGFLLRLANTMYEGDEITADCHHRMVRIAREQAARILVAAELTQKYLDKGGAVISEFSGDFRTDRIALLAEVNAYRATFGLEPLPAPDWWPDYSAPEEDL